MYIHRVPRLLFKRSFCTAAYRDQGFNYFADAGDDYRGAANLLYRLLAEEASLASAGRQSLLRPPYWAIFDARARHLGISTTAMFCTGGVGETAGNLAPNEPEIIRNSA